MVLFYGDNLLDTLFSLVSPWPWDCSSASNEAGKTRSRRREPYRRIRTFGLIGLLGGLWQLLAREAGEILFAIAFLAFVVLLAISHIAEARVSKAYGVTTLIAAMITFVLGALAVRGHHVIAATGAVLTTILLSLKPLLHSWLQRVEAAELAAALKLLLVSVVILPVLPDRDTVPGRRSILTQSGGWWSSWPRSPLPPTAR